MLSNIQYRYDIKFIYDFDGKEKEFDRTCITSLIINHDYDQYNMPLMYIKLSLDKAQIDYLIKNKNDKYINLTVDKFINNNKMKISTSYIKYRFIYFIDSNLNDMNNYDFNNTNKHDTVQREITIGLMKLENIDNNKRSISGIYRNCSILEILLSNLTHMKLLIEPDVNNTKVPIINIPIISTISKFIKYINDNYGIYNSMYRLYYDYDKTYLLSSSGKGIPSTDEKYNTILFNINESGTSSSRLQGMTIDDESSSYIIDLDQTDLNVIEDKSTTKSRNKIIGIDSQGNTKEININNNSSIDNNTKAEIIKVNNLKNIDILKSNIDTNRQIVNIVKAELDSSIFTINKAYYIKNHIDKKINGQYILSSKKEVYIRKDDNFLVNCLLTLRKIS